MEPQPIQPTLAGIPGCNVCGRKDETLRFVAYPFVVSVIFATFQRRFAGLWCSRHRFPKWLLASLITSIAGWLGIPFGLVFTPLTLFQLARGGYQDKRANFQLLSTLGSSKEQSGDFRTAIRCYEASLRFEDNEAIRQRLSSLYGLQRDLAANEMGSFAKLLLFLAVPLLAVVLGLFAGVLEYLYKWLLSSLLGSDLNIFVAILTWTPFVGMVFVSIIILRNLYEWALTTTRHTQPIPASGVAFVSSLLLAYSVAVGEALAKFFHYLSLGFTLGTLPNGLAAFGALLTRGGMYQFTQNLTTEGTAGYIYLAILLGGTLFSLFLLLPFTFDLTDYQKRLELLRSPTTESGGQAMAWVALGLVLAGLVSGFLAFPQTSNVDALESFDHTLAASNYQQSGDAKNAEKEYQEALHLQPNSELANLNLGFLHYSQGDYALAEERFQVVVKNDPNNAGGYLGLGYVYLQEDPEKAIDSFQKVLQIAPNVPDAYLGQGYAYIALSDYQNALAAFNQILALNPQYAPGYLGLGTVYAYQADEKHTIETLSKAIEIDPTLYQAYIGLGRAYSDYNQPDLSLKTYQQAIQVDPKTADAYKGLAGVYVLLDEHKTALENFSKAIEVDPTSDSLGLLAAFYYYAGNDQASESELQKALAAKKDTYDDNSALGYIYYGMNRYAEAEKYLLRALEQSPFKIDQLIALSLADMYSAQGKFEQAHQIVEQLLVLDPENARPHLMAANISMDDGKLDEALAAAQKALKLSEDKSVSNRAYSHKIISMIYLRQGQAEAAARESELAIQYGGNSGTGYTEAAFAYRAQGKLAEALSTAQKAVKYNPTGSRARFILAACYMDKGMKSEALAEFDKFYKYYLERGYNLELKAKANEYYAKLKSQP